MRKKDWKWSPDDFVEQEETDRHVLNHKQREWAYRKWCEGHTIRQIADALFVCTKTVIRAIDGRPRIRPILKYEEEGQI